MKKLLVLSLISLFACNTQVFSMESNNEISTSETENNSNDDNNYELFGSSSNEFFNNNEIKDLSEKVLNEIEKKAKHDLIKQSFHILNTKYNRTKLQQLFFSDKSDMEIIDEAINIVKKGIKEEKNFNKDIIKIFLRKTKDNDYMNYVIKDIIHNNIYSVVVSPLIKDKISSVESKVKNIKDNTRRMIVRNILQNKNIYDIFEDDPSNIGSSICKHYLVMLRGEHQDIYKDYTKYKTFSGLDFDTLKNILKDCNINNQNIPHIYSFVLDGYITNPDIVNYMISKYNGLNNSVKSELLDTMEDIYCVDNLYNNLFELKEKFIERFKQYQKPLIRNIYNEEEHEREISEYEKKIKIRLNNMILEEIIQENINLFNEQSEREEYIKYVKDFISK